ncbi:serine/threonine-protein phosphatase 7 long form homolog [Apium graveolens]|uniref:serine/threonine-protein phosphatase 7 long form homolog n=1 Tax=Apium graveolens TaxID=4045 RepID=UPI003D7974C4
MSECFNSWILRTRYMPIIDMLTEIHDMLMTRIHQKRDWMDNRDCIIVPTIKKLLDKAVKDSVGYKDVHPGPVNPSLLHLQHTHRSLDIWRLGGGDMLKCHRKNSNNEDDLPPLDLRMVPLLQSTGFYVVARVASLQLDWSLISALVEGWRPETHTFYLPMGEVTITLQDVGVLLGLPVDGDAVISDVTPDLDMSWRSYVAELFGRYPDPKRDMNGFRVRLSFITSCAPAHLPHDASADDIRFQVLCYLVHLFGGVLFTDHSGGLFRPMFLHFIRDLDRCRDYAWGAAVLAYLYRELCKTSKKDVDEVAGYLLLLQLWAWERLPTLAPIRTSSILFDARFWEGHVAAPRGLRWLHDHSYTSTGGRTLSAIRTLLDELGPSQFLWQTYSADVISELPAYYFTGERIWRYCGPLICIFIVELHCPDRVARQFGLMQTIPVDVVYSEADHSTNLRGNEKIRWIQKYAASTSIWAHRLDHLFVGDAIVAESSMPEYQP